MVGKVTGFLFCKNKDILYISSAIYNLIHHTWIFVSISHNSVSLVLTRGVTLISPLISLPQGLIIYLNVLENVLKKNGTQGFEMAPDVLFYRETLFRLGGEFQRE